MKTKIEPKRVLREYYIFIRDFIKVLFDDKLSYYSASLSFYTLFSIIPLLVIILSILTHLPIFDDIYKNIQDILFKNLMPTNSQEILTYINGFVANSAYGSLSILLFFFLWIYISWAIFLYGLKFCYILDREDNVEEII